MFICKGDFILMRMILYWVVVYEYIVITESIDYFLPFFTMKRTNFIKIM